MRKKNDVKLDECAQYKKALEDSRKLLSNRRGGAVSRARAVIAQPLARLEMLSKPVSPKTQWQPQSWRLAGYERMPKEKQPSLGEVQRQECTADVNKIPDDAVIMVDVDGTLLASDGVNDVLNTDLCELLRGRHVNLLTAMDVSNLQQVYSRVLAGDQVVSRYDLIRAMKLDFGITVERVIIPADAGIELGSGYVAGDSFARWIEPLYPLLCDCIAAGYSNKPIAKEVTYQEHDQALLARLNTFTDGKTRSEVYNTMKGAALAHYLEEHQDGKRPLVFFDDKDFFLNDVYKTCKNKDWDVCCFKVDTKPQLSTMQLFAPDFRDYRPVESVRNVVIRQWSEGVQYRVNGYYDRRSECKDEYKHRFFVGLGCSRADKLGAASALLRLQSGKYAAELVQKGHPKHQAYIKALKQNNSDLQQAVLGDGVPAFMQGVTSEQTTLNIVDALAGMHVLPSARYAVQTEEKDNSQVAINGRI